MGGIFPNPPSFFMQSHPGFGNDFWREFGYKRAAAL